MKATHTRFMKMALALGQRALGQTAPNPAVGCVIVKDGRVVGRGVTARGGRPHGEPQALAQAGARARGACVYVSLEPCAHEGQTPPCARALIDAGVAQVVIAAQDPNPDVRGRGAAMLRAAGIQVVTGVLEPEATLAHGGFFKVMQQGLPWVTLKLAASLDGRIATQGGQSQWITGPQARRMVHLQRARHDAVLVGAGTLRADDPSLTVRDLGVTHQPARVVMSRNLDIPLNAKLAQTAHDIPVYLVHSTDADANLVSAWQGLGAHMVAVPANAARHMDPRAALAALAQAGLTRIYCEGGGMLASALLQRDVVDEICVFQAGKVIGAEGRPMIGPLAVDQLDHAPAFHLVDHHRLGPDHMTTWRR